LSRDFFAELSLSVCFSRSPIWLDFLVLALEVGGTASLGLDLSLLDDDNDEEDE
jgi:hypothetical protein